jgi:hypothetical protein
VKFGTVAELWSKPREEIDFKAIVQKMRGG